jgi:hypothetical protein
MTAQDLAAYIFIPYLHTVSSYHTNEIVGLALSNRDKHRRIYDFESTNVVKNFLMKLNASNNLIYRGILLHLSGCYARKG